MSLCNTKIQEIYIESRKITLVHDNYYTGEQKLFKKIDFILPIGHGWNIYLCRKPVKDPKTHPGVYGDDPIESLYYYANKDRSNPLNTIQIVRNTFIKKIQQEFFK